MLRRHIKSIGSDIAKNVKKIIYYLSYMRNIWLILLMFFLYFHFITFNFYMLLQQKTYIRSSFAAKTLFFLFYMIWFDFDNEDDADVEQRAYVRPTASAQLPIGSFQSDS